MDLVKALTCIFLMVSDDEHFFHILFDHLISPLEKYLFESLAASRRTGVTPTGGECSIFHHFEGLYLTQATF